MGAAQSSNTPIQIKFNGQKKELHLNDDSYFVPKICAAWLIGVEDYSEVRNAKEDPKPFCKNLDQVPQDIEKMASFFQSL